jgi:uncharacterized protein (TIGR04255 family)
MSNVPIEIKTDEGFEIFPKAPIVEAVIDIRARSVRAFEETSVRVHLEAALTGYNFLDSQRAFQHEFKLEGGKPPVQATHDLGWKGLRFQSADKKHIAQFNRDGFVFSRLSPYINWAQFTSEGLNLWAVFRELAEPVEIHRIGLRFINRIVLPSGELRFEDYIQPAPAPPGGLDLPFLGYMHQDTLAVPGYPYALNVVQTIQPPPAATTQGVALILDIDVFTTQGFELEEAKLSHRLEEMRWLKDKVFFGNVTEKAKEMFR